MPKRAGRHPDKELTAVFVKNAGPGRYSDGGGLYLNVTPTLSKSWFLRVKVQGRRQDIGLGSVSTVPLAMAREEAHRLRTIARAGGNPLAERQAERRVIPTFAEAARIVHEGRKASWKDGGKHVDQWISSLEVYAFPRIGGLPVDEVGTPQVLEVLSPIWLSKGETARRVKQRIGVVLDWATAMGHREGENPARAVQRGLSSKREQVEHHRALPYDQAAAFVARLREAGDRVGSAAAFEFLILTLVRTNELIQARWPEIDENARVWSIPAERMKMERPHVVPLVPRAIEILRQARKVHSGHGDYIFESRPGRGYSNGVFLAAVRRMAVDATPHGFRSTFRDWAAEQTNFPREIAEKALAHAVGSKTEAAYQRGDLLLKRRKMMEAWARFLEPRSAKVIALRT